MKQFLLFSLLHVLLLAVVIIRADDFENEGECFVERKCQTRTCRCMSVNSPLNISNLPITQVPQFVMLSYDDAINAINYDPLYKDLYTNFTRANRRNGCNIGATFFASHEYNNYAHMHNLYRSGSEIAVHTITHESSTENWKQFNQKRWEDETVGMRQMIVKYAKIPEKDITGFRAPFLQTAGDVTFKMLKSLGDMYDCSMPTRAHTDPPIWPYTLDYGFTQEDCVVEPCPYDKYPGLWVVPMTSLFKTRKIGNVEEEVPCAMADGCLPYPETVEETYKYLIDNFNRHYALNRAPFPVFLHESWLKQAGRKQGYLKFIDEILKKDDVFIVPIQEVLNFMKDPKPLAQYSQTRCVKTAPKSLCSTKALPNERDLNGNFCNYEAEKTPFEGPRVMYTCNVRCPKVYPWLNNVNGE